MHTDTREGIVAADPQLQRNATLYDIDENEETSPKTPHIVDENMESTATNFFDFPLPSSTTLLVERQQENDEVWTEFVQNLKDYAQYSHSVDMNTEHRHTLDVKGRNDSR